VSASGSARPIASAIVSGEANYLRGPHSYIGGGRLNNINFGNMATIVNGDQVIVAYDNTLFGTSITHSTVVNGSQHEIINAPYSTVINGEFNKLTAISASNGNSPYSTIINGRNARIHAATHSLIGGGDYAQIGLTQLTEAALIYIGNDTGSGANTDYNAILVSENGSDSFGTQNIYGSTSSFLGTGSQNVIWGKGSSYSVINAGQKNQNIGCTYGFIGTGVDNRISSLDGYSITTTLYEYTTGVYEFEWSEEVNSGTDPVLAIGDYISFDSSGGTASTDIVYGHYYIITNVYSSGGVTRFRIGLRVQGNSIPEQVYINDPGTGGVTYTSTTHNAGANIVLMNGYQNQATSTAAVIGSGYNVKIGAESTYSVALNGMHNYINRAVESFIGSGVFNTINNTPVSAIITGEDNYIGTDELTVGGYGAYTGYSTIAGGRSNTIDGLGRYSFIDGGEFNTLTGTRHGAIMSSSNSTINQDNGDEIVGSYDTIIGSSYATIDLGGGKAIHNTIIGSANSGMTGNAIQNYIYFGSVNNSDRSWLISANTAADGAVTHAVINNSYQSTSMTYVPACELNEIHNSSNSVLGGEHILNSDASVFSDSSGTLAITLPYTINYLNIVFMPPVLVGADSVDGLTYGEVYSMTLVSGTTYEIDGVSYASLVINGTPTFQYVLSTAAGRIARTRILNSNDVTVIPNSFGGAGIEGLEVSNSDGIYIDAAFNSTITGSSQVNFIPTNVNPTDVNLINSKNLQVAGTTALFGANVIGIGMDVSPTTQFNNFISMINTDGTSVLSGTSPSGQTSLMNSYNDSVGQSLLSTLINTSSCGLTNANTSTIVNAIGCEIKDTVNSDGQPLSAIFNSVSSTIDTQGVIVGVSGYKIYNIGYNHGQGINGIPETNDRWSATFNTSDNPSLAIGDGVTFADVDSVWPTIDFNDYPELVSETHVITYVSPDAIGRTTVWFETAGSVPPSDVTIITGGTLGQWDNASASTVVVNSPNVVSSDTGSDTLVVVTSVSHGLLNGESTFIINADVAAADGVYVITYIDDDNFSYIVTDINLGTSVTELSFTQFTPASPSAPTYSYGSTIIGSTSSEIIGVGEYNYIASSSGSSIDGAKYSQLLGALGCNVLGTGVELERATIINSSGATIDNTAAVDISQSSTIIGAAGGGIYGTSSYNISLASQSSTITDASTSGLLLSNGCAITGGIAGSYSNMILGSNSSNIDHSVSAGTYNSIISSTGVTLDSGCYSTVVIGRTAGITISGTTRAVVLGDFVGTIADDTTHVENLAVQTKITTGSQIDASALPSGTTGAAAGVAIGELWVTTAGHSLGVAGIVMRREV
jgi:hypothetical protein